MCGVVGDGDGKDVMDVWGRLGAEQEFHRVPHHPEGLLRELVLVEDQARLQLHGSGGWEGVRRGVVVVVVVISLGK